MPRLPFTDFIAAELGTRRWCVAARSSASLHRRGYEVSITQKRYREIERRWHDQHPSAFEAALRPLMAGADEAQRRALAVAIDFGRRMALEIDMERMA